MVLSEMRSRSSKDHFILVSKVGYLQGPALQEIRRMEEEGRSFEGNDQTGLCLLVLHRTRIHQASIF